MPKAQVGSTFTPFLVKPRIKNLPVTVTDIKTQQSSLFVDDATTPINFTLEFKKRGDTTPSTIAWDPAKSTDSILHFDVPNSLYATIEDFSIMVFWTITNAPDTEKIYTKSPAILSVQDLHST